jgi:hypothetical protein
MGPLPAGQQAAGDCRIKGCDGVGNVTSTVDDSDLPVDGSDCTTDVCTNGTPTNPPVAEGTTCTQNAGEVCDPRGKCNRLLAYVVAGDGAAALTNAATQVSIGYLYADGTTTPRATTNVSAATFAISGTATSEGSLTRSLDAHFLAMAGYSSALGTASIATTTSATVNRAVARVSAAGVVDASTLLAASFNKSNPRGAATLDGSAFWVSGTGTTDGGVWYATLGSTGSSAVQIVGQTTPTANPPSNARAAAIFVDQAANQQLYTTSSTSTLPGVFSIAGEPPPITQSTATVLTGTGAGSPSPYGILMFDLDTTPGLETLYVCDDRSLANGGGLQRWKLGSGGTWTLDATLTNGLTAGCRWLTGWVSGANIVLVATTADSVPKLVTVTDDGSASPAFTALATSATNTAFRGVALAPR